MPPVSRRYPRWAASLLDWFDQHRRPMPWRDAPLPYAKNLEQAGIPHAADVVAAAKRTLGKT